MTLLKEMGIAFDLSKLDRFLNAWKCKCAPAEFPELQARQRAMDELGAQFDLKEFHNVVLTNGAMPLAVLDMVVDRYIADTLATP